MLVFIPVIEVEIIGRLKFDWWFAMLLLILVIVFVMLVKILITKTPR